MIGCAKDIVDELIERHYKLSFAETITGGGMTKEIIKIPNASKVIDYSLITYSNESKIKSLKVSVDTLFKHGAVSEETVGEMVQGLFEITKANICFASSGIAGPEVEIGNKPVGLVCVALKVDDNLITDTWYLGKLERELVIEATIKRSLEFILYNVRRYASNC